MDDKIFEMIQSDLKELKTDVKTLLKFKNRVAGLVIGVSMLCSVIATYIIK